MGRVSKTQIVKYIRKGDPGDKGERGPAMRGPQAWSDCATGYAFQAGGTGEEWKDVVLYNGNYYSCKKSHTKTSTNYPGSATSEYNGYWQLGDAVELVATKILLATYALVKNLGVEAIEMKDADGNMLFQAKNGDVTCKTGTFNGITVTDALIKRQRNPFTQIDDSFSALDDDTMYTQYLSSHTYITLGWDVKQSGRRILVLGSATFQAPADANQHYFLNGQSAQSFVTSMALTELVGWGTKDKFLGWVVVNNTDFRTTYFQGRTVRTLAYGKVQCNTSGNVGFEKIMIGSANSADQMYVTRGGTGIYYLWVPVSWYYSTSEIHCMVCGYGPNRGSSSGSSAVFANVYGITKSTYNGTQMYRIEVRTADDASLNDGGFTFELKNLGAWDD